MIRPVKAGDDEAIAAIYNPFVAETTVTFEEEAVSAAQIRERIGHTTATHPYLVLEEEGRVAGYAYASAFRARPAYRFTAETTIYLAAGATGRGQGARLYRALLDMLKKEDFHTALGIIALPNEASVRLHQKLGFEKIGQIAQVGFKFGRWIDTGYWQLHL